jgi:signal peptidase I
MMDFIGLTLFPAISANVYYHYVSKRYGMMPNITFRLITTLYIYFIPMVTGMPDSLTSCIKIMLPMAMLALTVALFDKKKKNAVRKGRKLGLIGMLLTVAIIVSVAMLVSCQFRFGALVIATESMTGEINKGDVIVYERYDGQAVKEGQVIVFLQDGTRIVHRVVAVENIGGEVRYYTKGDANDVLDSGYRVASDIVGTTDMKLAFIGYPTLWIREIIKN